MTTQEREVITSARIGLNWANYMGPLADYYQAQLHSQDALDEFDRIISTCYHIEEYKCGNI